MLAAISYSRLCELAGYPVPRVADVMTMIAGKATGHLDLKDTGGEEKVVEMALDILGPGNFVVTTLEDRRWRDQGALPRGPRGAVARPRPERGAAGQTAATRLSELFPMRRLRACHADWVAVHRRLAAAGVLAQCHRAGIKTMVWTVDEDAEIRRWLADPRVTVLITNRPADAVAMRSCPARPAASPGP